MPAIDYRRARAELRLADVLALIGYRPRTRQGWQWRGPCRCMVRARLPAVALPPTWGRTCFTVFAAAPAATLSTCGRG